MTGTKRLSLHGRLRMAAACPDPNAALLAEAADAIEQHEAFRQEVSDAIYVDVVAQVRCGIDPKFRTNSVRFVIAKPDPLVEAIEDAWGPDLSGDNYKRASASLREAIAKRGGKIVWED